jgi:hypothetical protein
MKSKSSLQLKSRVLNSDNIFSTSFKQALLVLVFSFGFIGVSNGKSVTKSGELITPKHPNSTTNTTHIDPSKPTLEFLKQVESFDDVSLPESKLNIDFNDKTTIRNNIKKTFSPGYYNIVVEGKDGYRLSLDGGLTFAISNLKNHEFAVTSKIFYLSGKTNLVLEYYEQGGQSQVSFTYIGDTNPNSQTKEIEKKSEFVMEQEQF